MSVRTEEFTPALSTELSFSIIGIFPPAGILLGFFYPYLGTVLLVLGGWFYWRWVHGYGTPLSQIPGRESAVNILAEVPAKEEPRRRVVLLANSAGREDGAQWKFLPFRTHTVRCSRGFLMLICCAVPWTWLGSRWAEHLWYQAVSWALLLMFAGIALVPVIALLFSGDDAEAHSGAGDTAALLQLGESFAASPLEQTEVRMLFLGDRRPGLTGIRDFLSRHEVELPGDSTVFLYLRGIAEKGFRYGTGEGCMSFWGYDPLLIDRAGEVMTAHGYDRAGARLWGGITTTRPLIQKGYRCLTFTGAGRETDGTLVVNPRDDANIGVSELHKRVAVIKDLITEIASAG